MKGSLSRRGFIGALAAAGACLALPVRASPVGGDAPVRIFLPLVTKNWNEAIDLGLRFLDRQFNPLTGLYREAPNVFPNRHWIYSDAYLAGLNVSGWDVPVLTKWTVVVEGASVPEETFVYRHNYITVSADPLIMSEEHDTKPPFLEDWAEYADRLLLAALSARNRGDTERFDELVAIARAMWDGRGMCDKFHRVEGYYQTYHVALYYVATREPAARAALLAQQERDGTSNRFGGFYTGYDADGMPPPGTDANIETTSLALRALGWRPSA